MSTSPKQERADWGALFRRPRFICLLLAVVTLAVFWQVKNCDFINYDDPAYMTANVHVERGLTFSGVVWALGTGRNGNWHPLTWLSHMLDAELFGLTAFGPHVTNLLLHVANSVLLFLLLRNLTAAHWRSAFVAALFALHPLHVESVAWISERKDLLSTCFGLLTLLLYARYAQQQSRAEPPSPRFGEPRSRESSAGSPIRTLDARRSTLDYSLALVFFALSLMSKPMLVTLPFVLLLLDYWPLGRVPGARRQVPGEPAPGDKSSPPASPVISAPRRDERRSSAGDQPKAAQLPGSPKLGEGGSTLRSLLREKSPFFLLSAVSCVITLVAQSKGGALHTLANLPLGLRIENAVVSYARYLGKIVWPVDLAVPYPHPGQWPWVWVVLGAVLVVGLSAAALGPGRRLPFLVTGWFWFLGTLIPVIGLVQVGMQAMADRYTYVPSIGLFVALTWGAQTIRARWRLSGTAAGGVALVILAACAGRTLDQLQYWRNSGSLFRHALAVTKNNIVAHDNLAAWFFDQGRVGEAMEQSREALRINPEDPLARNNLGHAFFLQGRVDEAMEQFNRAIELKPDYAGAWENLGSAFLQRNQCAEAIRCYDRAVQLRPDSAEAHHQLGGAHLQQREYAKAIPCFEIALRLRPNFPEAHILLATALREAGRTDDAIRHGEAALRLTPDDVVARVFLADMLLGQGRIAEASGQYREALRLAPDNAVAHLGLGRALAGSGRREEAVAQLKEALRLKPDFAEAERALRELEVSAPPARN